MTDRLVFTLSFGVLVLLAIMSVVWYQERMLYVDPAFVAFDIMHTKRLVISEHRYGAFVTQIFPLAGAYLGLSVKSILLLYSASFYAFYLSVAACLGWWWKQYALGTLLVVYLTLTVSDVYFWPNNEIHQAVGYLLLFLGFYQSRLSRSVKWWEHLLMFVLLLLGTISHPLAAAPLLFLWVYLGLSANERPRQLLNIRWLGYSLTIVAAIALRYYLSQDSWYDGVKLGAVKDIGWDRISNAFNSPQARSMAARTISDYWQIYPVLLIGSYAVLSARKWWLLPLTLAALTGYFVLVCVTYPGAVERQNLFYFESEWAGWGLMLATPLVIHALPRLKWWVAVIGMTVLYGFTLQRIRTSSEYFSTRVENLAILNEWAGETSGGKLLLALPADWISTYFGSAWGLPAETVLKSMIDERSISTTVKVGSPVILDTASDNIFHGCFTTPMLNELDPHYQRLSQGVYDTLSPTVTAQLQAQLVPLPK